MARDKTPAEAGEKYLIRIDRIITLLKEININIRSIRDTNGDLVVGVQTQNKLAREQRMKMNGVGLFLTILTEIKEKEWKEKHTAWEDEYD